LKSERFSQLIDLRLDMNKISETKYLAYNCKLENIERVTVRDNLFGSLGCFYLQVYAFRNLNYLNISKNNVGDDGVQKLC
jgi:Leucine Rich repeat